MNVTHLSILYRETKSEEIVHYNLLKIFTLAQKMLQYYKGVTGEFQALRNSKYVKLKKCCVLKLISFLLPKASYSTILSMAILLLVCFNLLKQRQKIGHMYRLLSVIHKMCINHWMRDVPGI